jgi:hypothetical protein
MVTLAMLGLCDAGTRQMALRSIILAKNQKQQTHAVQHKSGESGTPPRQGPWFGTIRTGYDVRSKSVS